MPRIEGAGDICLRRPRHTQGCRADDDDNDDDYDDDDYGVALNADTMNAISLYSLHRHCHVQQISS
jgi:hypothetical protein